MLRHVVEHCRKSKCHVWFAVYPERKTMSDTHMTLAEVIQRGLYAVQRESPILPSQTVDCWQLKQELLCRVFAASHVDYKNTLLKSSPTKEKQQFENTVKQTILEIKQHIDDYNFEAWFHAEEKWVNNNAQHYAGKVNLFRWNIYNKSNSFFRCGITKMKEVGFHPFSSPFLGGLISNFNDENVIHMPSIRCK